MSIGLNALAEASLSHPVATGFRNGRRVWRGVAWHGSQAGAAGRSDHEPRMPSRFGTEWATRHHLTGEMFLLVDRSAIKTADLPAGSVGAQAVAKALGIGDGVPLPSAGCPVGGGAMRPLSPCHIKLRRVCNTVHASWVPRSRKNWAWYDQVDGQQEPFSERFRVWFSGPGGEIEMDASMPSLALETTAINAEPGQLATLSVAAVGPSALSQKISTSFTI